jgi:hypothetical protein
LPSKAICNCMVQAAVLGTGFLDGKLGHRPVRCPEFPLTCGRVKRRI